MSGRGHGSRVGRADAALAAALVALGAMAWLVDLSRPTWRVDARSLARLPLEVGPWHGRDVPLAGSVEEILDADLHVQRIYEMPHSPPLSLYIGYYGTTRGGRPEHTPRGCFVGAGWTIERAEVLHFDIANPSAAATEYRVERGGHRQLVLYWYRSYRRTGMTEGFRLSWERLVGRLTAARADGALVRLGTPIVHPGDDARLRLTQFAQRLDPLLGKHWPREVKDPRSSPLADVRPLTLGSDRGVHPKVQETPGVASRHPHV